MITSDSKTFIFNYFVNSVLFVLNPHQPNQIFMLFFPSWSTYHITYLIKQENYQI